MDAFLNAAHRGAKDGKHLHYLHCLHSKFNSKYTQHFGGKGILGTVFNPADYFHNRELQYKTKRP